MAYSGSKYGDAVRKEVARLRAGGLSMQQTANKTGVNRHTIASWEKQGRFGGAGSSGGKGQDSWIEAAAQSRLPAPKRLSRLNNDAARALDDFPFWRQRYLGRRSVPWQIEAAGNITDWLTSDRTELIVMNCPPGSGKSTLWTDLMAWLICRDRDIRILFGSRTATLATQPVNRVRRLLERTRPVRDAEYCLSVEYGRFKPDMQDIWRRNEFSVMGMDDQPLEDKEPTVAAYGMESEFLGHRGNLVLWDDLVVGSTLKNSEQVEAQQKWWEEEGSTRVEPGGCLVLNGQRMGPNDLYRYSLDQKLEDTDTPRFRHVIYPAHYDDACKGDEYHEPSSPAWPDGCLLDPIRLPWRGASGLMTIQRNRADKYRVQYQQEDTDPTSVLVPRLWIDGGRDRDGIEYPGCLDQHRSINEIPRGLAPPVYSIATADPSPTKYWSVQWWLVHPPSEQRFLINHIRQSMDAPDFLDWNENTRSFFGVMEDWQNVSKDLGYPISHWIVENNAAQRFILQYDHVRRWQAKHGVNILPHSTGVNKLDAEYGLQMLANKYRFGNVRLPYKHGGFSSINPATYLINEATRYPDSATDDCLMAQWFLEYNLPKLTIVRHAKRPVKVPSWMKKSA